MFRDSAGLCSPPDFPGWLSASSTHHLKAGARFRDSFFWWSEASRLALPSPVGPGPGSPRTPVRGARCRESSRGFPGNGS